MQQNLSDVSVDYIDYEALEISVFGCSAKQSAALPKLLRVLNQAALLLAWAEEHKRYQPQVLDPIETDKSDTAWGAGRLLALPGEYSVGDFVIKGTLSSGETESLNWLLDNPWAFLLAQWVYVQDLWRSEQIAGGLRLELEEGYKDQFYSPVSIHVVVITELACAWEDLATQKQEPPTWKLVKQLQSLGVSGIQCRSFAPGCTEKNQNLVLWQWSDTAPNSIQIIDDFVPTKIKSFLEK